jgi:NAD(P)-dependent dehydrogenase (short-subunit alcohol dehydrogenase family)
VNSFAGGIAVITGAGSGIGAGLASHATQLGMTVVLADVDAAAIEALTEGRFYLITEPSVADAMAERADVLASQRPPLLKPR